MVQLPDDHFHGGQTAVALFEVPAECRSGLVSKGGMHMQGDFAVLLCADDAAHGDQLDGAGQLDGVAVAVQPRLAGQLLRVEEAAPL